MELIEAQQWRKAAPSSFPTRLGEDCRMLELWVQPGLHGLSQLPASDRGEAQQRTASLVRDSLAETRAGFIRVHGRAVYDQVTDARTQAVRVEDLVYRIAEDFPGLCPTRAQVDADSARSLRDKHGHELSQGVVLAELLAIPEVGFHLMATMRRPKPHTRALLERFMATDAIQLGPIELVRVGKAGHLTLANVEFLNAEDDELNAAMESAVDLVLLDPRIEIGVLRGGVMEHAKYRGRRVFCSGVNLTKLFAGSLSYMFYVSRELGLMSKIYRGLFAGFSVVEVPDRGIEKPWIAAVDSHAIGGGCQLLLVCDHVIAAADAYFTIPARTEGFIPGVANLRLPRYVGQRLANRIIYANHRVDADSDEGRLLVDEVVDGAEIDAAIDAAIESGVGMVANRKAMRQGAEPLDLFRTYMATFCREQATCMHSAEIVDKLDKAWVQRRDGRERTRSTAVAVGQR